VQTIAPSLTLEVIRSDIIGPLLELSKDPIPNIRFNVGKALGVIAESQSKTPEGVQFVKEWVVPALERQKQDTDADVRYYATRSLQKAVASS